MSSFPNFQPTPISTRPMHRQLTFCRNWPHPLANFYFNLHVNLPHLLAKLHSNLHQPPTSLETLLILLKTPSQSTSTSSKPMPTQSNLQQEQPTYQPIPRQKCMSTYSNFKKPTNQPTETSMANLPQHPANLHLNLSQPLANPPLQPHRERYSRPQPGCHLPNSTWAGIMTSYINYSHLGRVW